MSGQNDLDNLIEMMAKLPGLGPRSARRAVLHMIKKRALMLIPLSDTLTRVAETARECLNCGKVGTTDLCEICQSEKSAKIPDGTSQAAVAVILGFTQAIYGF